MTTPGFSAGAVRFQARGIPPQPQQSPARPSRGASRPRPVRSAPPNATELLQPLFFILIANVLILAGAFGVLTLVLSPFGIMAIIQGIRFGVNGVRMALRK